MKEEIIGLLFLGVILLSIGLVASFYAEVKTLPDLYGYSVEISRNYPYQNVGIVLILSGITLFTIGLVTSLKQ